MIYFLSLKIETNHSLENPLAIKNIIDDIEKNIAEERD